ncbi:MAG: AAC(3) family N-acetyltransferase [Chloroflexota bacterium]|nr:AAC(3) family N-acetyltransferase [Chloroflexota bacterium]
MSPYGRLAKMPDSFVLLIGVDHQKSTMFHYVEEMVGVEYHMQPGFARARIIVNGEQTFRHVMLHRYGTPRDFNRMEPLFLEQGIQRDTSIGNTAVRLVNVAGMVRTTTRALSADTGVLCAR